MNGDCMEYLLAGCKFRSRHDVRQGINLKLQETGDRLDIGCGD